MPDQAAIRTWVRACLIIFFIAGLGIGTWFSRLPTLRDSLDASLVQMSIYGLCLAAGSLTGLVLAGPLIERLQPHRAMAFTIAVLAVTMPAVAALLTTGHLVLGLVVLFLFGFCFSTTDIAMNVSGANAERAERRSRLPLMHACYSIGSVISMLIGAAAEAMRISLLPHFFAVSVLIVLCAVVALPKLPKNETALRVDSEPTSQDRPVELGESPAKLASHLYSTGGPETPEHKYRPWRDRRILLIGVIALIAGLLEGTPSDWLPLALVDGRGASNQFATVMLGLFFASIVSSRLLGAMLLGRFGRVKVLRVSLAVAAIGVLTISLVPGSVAMVIGTLAWGLGIGLCWPVAISASADNPKTAVRDVAAVSAAGYTSLVLGPMAFGFAGDEFGLLQTFLVLPLCAVIAFMFAGATRIQSK